MQVIWTKMYTYRTESAARRLLCGVVDVVFRCLADCSVTVKWPWGGQTLVQYTVVALPEPRTALSAVPCHCAYYPTDGCYGICTACPSMLRKDWLE